MKYNKRAQFTIAPTPPFHFDGTFHKPSHFPNKLDEWISGKYWQTIRLGDDLFGVKVENDGTVNQPQIVVSLYSDRAIATRQSMNIKEELTWRFDLTADLTEFNKLIKKDKRFSPVFKHWIGMRHSSQYNLYELLMIAIVLQNTTARRTVQMLDALLNKLGTKLRFDGKELYAIWLPQAILSVSEQNLKDLRIGYRARLIKKLSQSFIDKCVNEVALRKLDDDLLKKELIKLYGVGPETARILLSEVFHRHAVFDHIAPWQQKIYSRLFYDEPLVPTERICDDIRRQYGEYSALAVHYIWEDIFWKRKNEHIEWLEKEIRL